MIRVEGLKAGYRSGFRRAWKEVLLGLSFQVPRGSITGYLGINGAGKTTTIKVLVGINAPSAGQVTVAGEPAGTPRAQRSLGYFPEAPFFYDGLSGIELLQFYARLSGVERSQRIPRAEALLEEVGLREARDIPVSGYSKGMRQRLGLAQALVHEPELLILDEPLDGLDPMGRLRLRELIVRQREQNRTVFFSSHVLSDVEAVSDHLVVLDGGGIAYDGATGEFASGLSEGPQAIEVRFQGPAEARQAVAGATGVEVDSRNDVFVLTCAGQEAADQALEAIRAAGGRLLGFEPRRHSLEAAFLARFGTAKPAPPAVEEQVS